jgi:hypothetical protein
MGALETSQKRYFTAKDGADAKGKCKSSIIAGTQIVKAA